MVFYQKRIGRVEDKMWHKREFSQSLIGFGEFTKIRTDLLSGADYYRSYNHQLEEDWFSYTYLVSRDKKDYLLGLTMSMDRGQMSIEITSNDEKTLEDEIQRARALVDNTTRIERRNRRSLATLR